MAATGGESGGDVEQFGDEAGLRPHVASANTPYLPFPHHRHHLVARQCSSRRPEAAEGHCQVVGARGALRRTTGMEWLLRCDVDASLLPPDLKGLGAGASVLVG